MTADRERYTLNKNNIILPQGMDAAIIKFKSKKAYKVATIGNYNIPVLKKQLVFVSGFPGELDGVRKFTAGYRYQRDRGLRVAFDSINLDVNTTGYELIYTNLTKPGMSGGPVLDINGQVIGINTGQEGETISSEEIAQLGFAVGVPASTLIGFANQKQVNLNHFTIVDKMPVPLKEQELKTIKQHPAFIIEKPPENSNRITWLNYGNELWRIERYKEAIAALNKAIDIDPNFAEAYYALGSVYSSQALNTDNDSLETKAIAAFEQVISLSQYRFLKGPAWYKKSISLNILGKHEEALIAIDQAIKSSIDDDAKFYSQRAFILEDLNRYAEAKEAYTKSLEIFAFGQTYFAKCNLLFFKLKELEAAIEDCSKAIKLGFIEAYSYRGLVHSALDKEKEALADHNQAIALAPNSFISYYFRASTYNNMGEYEQAIADYTKVIELAPKDPSLADWYFLRAYLYYKMGDDKKVLADLNKAIEIDPIDPEYYAQRGRYYDFNGQYALAIKDMTKAIDLKPDHADYYDTRGDFKYSLGDSHGALEDYNQAIELDPNHAPAYFRRGGLYANQFKDYEKAMKDYDRAIEINPKYGVAYESRGILRKSLSDLPGALGDYNRAIALIEDPDPAIHFIYYGTPPEKLESWFPHQLKEKPISSYDSAYKERGNVRLKLKDYQGALEDFNEAIRLNPNDGGNYVSRGDYYTQTNQEEKAKADYNKAIKAYSETLKTDPNNPLNFTVYSSRADLYKKLKNYPAVIADLTKTIELTKVNKDRAYMARAFVYRDIKEYKLAIEDVSQAIVIKPNSPDLYFFRGVNYVDIKNSQAAIEDFSDVIELNKKVANPQFFNTYMLRGNLYQQSNNYPEAIDDFSSFIKLQPNSPQSIEAYAKRSVIYAQLKNYPAAIKDFSKIIELNEKTANSQYFAAYMLRGRLYKQLNNYPGAIKDLSTFIKLQPNNHQGYLHRCGVYTDLKDYNQAMNDCNQAIKIAPNNPEVYAGRAYVYARLKNNSASLKDANKIIKLAPNLPIGYYVRGVIYWVQNNPTKALSDYELALNKNDKFAPAISSIGFITYQQGDKQKAVELWQKAINLKDDLADTKLALAAVLYHQGKPEKALYLAKEAINMDRRLENINYLQDNFWSEQLIKDTKPLLNKITNP
ncbi:MAG: tetratricopeptide repeat protein [Crocosphaera sp.]